MGNFYSAPHRLSSGLVETGIGSNCALEFSETVVHLPLILYLRRDETKTRT